MDQKSESSTELQAAEQKLSHGRGSQLYERIHSLKITDEETFRLIQSLTMEAKRFVKTIEGRFEASVKTAKKSHTEALAVRDEALRLFEEAEALGKQKIAQWCEAVGADPDVQGVSRTHAWTFEITDSEAVPRDLLVPDEKKIRALVQALGKRANIPGVVVMPVTLISLRTGE